MTALLSGSADIVLIGPEASIYVQNSESPVKPKIFAGLTATDGFSCCRAKPIDKFDWSMVKARKSSASGKGSNPLVFLETVLRKHGIDPQKDVKLLNQIGIPARAGAWMAGQGEYGIFLEPRRASWCRNGKGPHRGLGRARSRPGRLHRVHLHRQVHPRQPQGDPGLDQRGGARRKYVQDTPASRWRRRSPASSRAWSSRGIIDAIEALQAIPDLEDHAAGDARSHEPIAGHADRQRGDEGRGARQVTNDVGDARVRQAGQTMSAVVHNLMPAAAAAKIELREVSLSYFTPEGETEALSKVSFSLAPGEFVSLIGQSGCGKSTLLSLIAGLIRRPRAPCWSTERRSRALAAHRLHAAAGSISSSGAPSWTTSCWAPRSRAGATPSEARAVHLLEKCGLGAFLEQTPRQLSGGMRQRAALRHAGDRARCHPARRAVLCAGLADAPGDLGRGGGHPAPRTHKTVVLVTHDIGEAIVMTDRVIVLSRRPTCI